MAHVVSSNVISFNIADRLRGVMADLRAARARNAAFNRAYAELQSLTEEELIEFGMHRSDLAEIARQHADAA